MTHPLGRPFGLDHRIFFDDDFEYEFDKQYNIKKITICFTLSWTEFFQSDK